MFVLLISLKHRIRTAYNKLLQINPKIIHHGTTNLFSWSQVINMLVWHHDVDASRAMIVAMQLLVTIILSFLIAFLGFILYRLSWPKMCMLLEEAHEIIGT